MSRRKRPVAPASTEKAEWQWGEPQHLPNAQLWAGVSLEQEAPTGRKGVGSRLCELENDALSFARDRQSASVRCDEQVIYRAHPWDGVRRAYELLVSGTHDQPEEIYQGWLRWGDPAFQRLRRREFVMGIDHCLSLSLDGEHPESCRRCIWVREERLADYPEPVPVPCEWADHKNQHCRCFRCYSATTRQLQLRVAQGVPCDCYWCGTMRVPNA